MSWQDKVSDIAVGDKVCFKASFLRNTGQQVGESGFMRGNVVSLSKIGDTAIAKVDWHDGEGPKGVALANLSKVTTRGIADE